PRPLPPPRPAPGQPLSSPRAPASSNRRGMAPLLDWREILRTRKKPGWRAGRAVAGPRRAPTVGDEGVEVDFAIAEDERTFRNEIRAFLRSELPPEAVAEAQSEERISTAGRQFIRKLGERKWISLTWPPEWDGQDRPAMDRFILNDELIYAEAPGAVGTNVGGRIVAPTLLMYGTEEQKREILPKIATGDVDFALGYTEPDAGSDLAGIQTRAEWDGEEFIVNGQK